RRLAVDQSKRPGNPDDGIQHGRAQSRRRRARRALPAPPPNRAVMPMKKPKLYHAPLLCTSYICTPLSNREMMKVTGVIAPFHKPRQKPATTPVWLGTCDSSLMPGAQLASIRRARTRVAKENAFFMKPPPHPMLSGLDCVHKFPPTSPCS